MITMKHGGLEDEMRQAKKKGNVNIWLDFLNYCGEVTESHLIATFFNMNWAKLFLQQYNENEEESKNVDYSYTKLRLEEIK